MKNTIIFKGEELTDLYYALATAGNYYADRLVESKSECAYNLTAENYAEYRKWEIRHEETIKMKDRVFALIYEKIIKK